MPDATGDQAELTGWIGAERSRLRAQLDALAEVEAALQRYRSLGSVTGDGGQDAPRGADTGPQEREDGPGATAAPPVTLTRPGAAATATAYGHSGDPGVDEGGEAQSSVSDIAGPVAVHKAAADRRQSDNGARAAAAARAAVEAGRRESGQTAVVGGPAAKAPPQPGQDRRQSARCARCSKPFEPRQRGGHVQRYCSVTCRKRVSRERRGGAAVKAVQEPAAGAVGGARGTPFPPPQAVLPGAAAT